jgi:hypothetical protein
MDPLDRLAEVAGGLLGRVDEILTRRGAPAGHPVWPLLRQLRILPGAAVAAVAEVRPGALSAAGSVLDQLRLGYEDAGWVLADRLPVDRQQDVRWSGAAADSFAAQGRGLADHLAGGPASLSARVTATADYAAALVDWIGDTRVGLAAALAEVLGSAQAVTLLAEAAGPGPSSTSSGADLSSEGAVAAADVAVHVLTVLDRACRIGERLRRESGDRLAELPLRLPAPTAEPAAVDPWRGTIHFGGQSEAR